MRERTETSKKVSYTLNSNSQAVRQAPDTTPSVTELLLQQSKDPAACHKVAPPPVMQRKIYLGTIELGAQDLLEYHLQQQLAKSATSDYIDKLSGHLWGKFGIKPDSHTTIESIVKIVDERCLTVQKRQRDAGKTEGILNAKSLVVTPVPMTDEAITLIRRKADIRLPSELKKKYAKKRKVTPKMKEEVKRRRMNRAERNSTDADKRLATGSYMQDIQEDKDIRAVDIDSCVGKLQDYTELFKLPDARDIYTRVLDKVLAMKGDLVAAWYYNVEGEKKILDSGGQKSHDLLPAGSETKTMDVDVVKNKTDSYCYSFIEHKDSEFNTNTRFTQPAAVGGYIGLGGVRDGTGRRLRYPLSKTVKSGAIIMGGDLETDRQEEKMGLDQNDTPNKFFASGSKAKSEDEKMDGLLTNYVNFVFSRMYLAMPNWFVWLRSLGGNKPAGIAKLEQLSNKANGDPKELWEYLVRDVAQPQLMTPKIVSFGMKGIVMDKSPVLP